MLQKYHSDDLLNFCAIYEAQNADNARTFRIWFDDKLCEVYAQNDFTIVRVWQEWKNYVNRSTFAQVLMQVKCIVFRHSVYYNVKSNDSKQDIN